VTSTKPKYWLREREKQWYPFCDLLNPKETHLCDQGDNLSRP